MGGFIKLFKKIFNILTKSLLWIFISLISIVVLVFVLLKIPAVQRKVVYQAEEFVSNSLDAKVEIGTINIRSIQTLVVTNIRLYDQENKLIFETEEFLISLSPFDLLKKKIAISEVSLENTQANIYRKNNSKDFNYSFLIKPKSNTTSQAWQIDLANANVQNIVVTFHDSLLEKHFKGGLTHLQVSFKELDTEKGSFIIDKAVIDNLDFSFRETLTNKYQEPNSGVAQPWLVKINDLYVNNSSISYEKQGVQKVNDRIDWNDLNVNDFNTYIKSITLSENNYQANINELSLSEKDGFAIKELEAKIYAPLPAISIELQELKTAVSSLNGSVSLKISDIKNLSDNLGQLEAKLDFQKGRIARSDIEHFTGKLNLDPLDVKTLFIEGAISGKIKDIIGNKVVLSTDNGIAYKGSFHVKNLPDWKQSTVNLDITNLSISNQLLARISKGKTDGIDVKSIGDIKYQGTIDGSINDFSSQGKLYSGIGSIDQKLKFKFDNNFKPLQIAGNVKITNFNAGKLTGSQDLGIVNTAFDVNTKGNKIELNDGVINSATLKGYEYKDIRYNLSYFKNTIEADLRSNDTNALGKICGAIDFTKNNPVYTVNADLKKLDLEALNISKKPITLSGDFDLHATGNSMDSIQGFFVSRNFVISEPSFSYKIDSAKIFSTVKDSYRSLNIVSPVITASLKGNYLLSELPEAAVHLISHYYTGLGKVKDTHVDDIEFDVKILDHRLLSSIFFPEIKELRNFYFNGKFNNHNHILDGNLVVDRLVINDIVVDNLSLKTEGRPKVFTTLVKASRIGLSDKVRFNNSEFVGNLYKDSLAFNISSSDSLLKSSIAIKGTTLYTNDFFVTKIPQAKIVLSNNTWNLHEEPTITIGKNHLEIQDLHLTALPEQSIIVNSRQNNVHAEIKNVIIEQIIQLTGLNYPVKGVLTGKGNLSNSENSYSFDGNVEVQRIAYENLNYGNASLRFSKKTSTDLISLDFLLKEKTNIITGNGTVSTLKKGKVDLSIKAENYPTKNIQPFVKRDLYKLDGIANLTAKITGTVSEPLLDGKLSLPGKHTIGLVLTNSEYYLYDQSINFDQKNIHINSLTLVDKNGSEATANGTVYHGNFADPQFNLTLKAKNFLVTDSNVPSALPFYGQVYANFGVYINGPLTGLQISINATTQKNSKIIMGITTGSSQYSTPDYIHFKSDNHLLSKRSAKQGKAANETSLNISGEINISENTLVNLIVDPANGDRIIARGEGRFTFEFNTNSDLNLFGTYTISEGNYTFTFLDLVKKDFQIVEGSTVSWVGDLEKGMLNVTATYTTDASRMPLISDQREMLSAAEINAAGKHLPVKVLLYLKGDYMKPDISFGIEVPETQSEIAGGMVSQRINEIMGNPSELNKQVLGLIAFDQFMPYQGWGLQGGDGGGALAAQSVSQLLNSQLSKITNEISGLDLEVSLNPGSQITNQSVNVRASKDITDRLSISVGGDYVTSSTTNTSGSVFLGDYVLYYRLNSKGSLRIKVFSRGQQNLYTDNIQQISGLSIQYSRSFDSFGKRQDDVPQQN